MEILINELSLSGQFASEGQFIQEALLPFSSILKEIDSEINTICKKQDLWNYRVTSVAILHDVLIQRTDEARRFKSLISCLLNEPYWESDRKHAKNSEYLYNDSNVCGQSLAEACVRDRVVISFTHDDYTRTQLSVMNNNMEVRVDNLFDKGHYIELAHQRNTIPYSVYFEWKFANAQCSLLENTERFRRLGQSRQGQPVYEEIVTGYYWYLDNFHHNHYEVFDSNEHHLGTADMQGNMDTSKLTSGRRL